MRFSVPMMPEVVAMDAKLPRMRSNGERAKEIATKANECCYRGDGFEDEIFRLALRLLDEAWAEGRYPQNEQPRPPA